MTESFETLSASCFGESSLQVFFRSFVSLNDCRLSAALTLSNLGSHVDIPLFSNKSRGTDFGVSAHLIYDTSYGDSDGGMPFNTGWRIVAGSSTGGRAIVTQLSPNNY